MPDRGGLPDRGSPSLLAAERGLLVRMLSPRLPDTLIGVAYDVIRLPLLLVTNESIDLAVV